MKELFRRLDKYSTAMIDADSLLSSKGRLKLLPLKVVFDNLRYYPALGFMWVGVRLLASQDGWMMGVACYCLGLLTIWLACLVAVQSSYILLASALTITASLARPRWAARVRRRLRSGHSQTTIVVLVGAIAISVAMVTVATALLSALSKANLL